MNARTTAHAPSSDSAARYNRLTHVVEDLTGRPAHSVQEYISQRSELFT
jgi:hypothetical protein